MTVRLLHGDCRDVLRTLPDQSVHCCVTSPPYWGLRDYGVDGQIGLESSPEAYVAEMVAVFREVRRALRDDGTLWLNLGDSYATGAGKVGSRPGGGAQGDAWNGHRGSRGGSSNQPHSSAAIGPLQQPNRMRLAGFKAKDLVGIPWRVAFALQADGWYLRQDIIWHKPNPMPESVTDRCTKAHEYLFLLSKARRYYFDQAAIFEPCSRGTHPRRKNNGWKTPDGWDTSKGSGGHGTIHREGREHGQTGYERKPNKSWNGSTFDGPRDLIVRPNTGRKRADPGIKNNSSMDEALSIMPEKRNKRSVWTIAAQPFSEAHFATFPPALVEPCILAGCPEGGVALDPFGGAGTVGLVADRLRRNAILIELNPGYVEMAKTRMTGDCVVAAA